MSVSSAVHAATVLFPTPLHIVRKYEDPITAKSTTIDEYCEGNRIVRVNGARTSMIDYGAQQLIEIDRAAGTYSVTKFDDIAKAAPRTHESTRQWKTTATAGRASAGGRALESFEIVSDGMKIDVGVDRSVTLSRDAVEALIGAAYPNNHTPQHDALLSASSPQRGGRAGVMSSADAYGLPAEQTVTITEDGRDLVARNSVVAVDNGVVPAAAVAIDPHARRVESPVTLVPKELEKLDRLPAH